MRFVAWTALLAACEPMPATGDPLAPVRPREVAAAAPTPASKPAIAPSSDEGFDFGEDEGTDGPASDVPDDPAALLAMAQGKPPPAPVPVAPAPAPAPLPAPVAGPVPTAASALPWDPANAPALDWGVHLVSTLLDTQPPMAVLGLPDGSKVVLQPGSFLPEHQLVVLAVGRDVAQVARVIPDGYAARVETRTLASLFPASGRLPAVP